MKNHLNKQLGCCSQSNHDSINFEINDFHEQLIDTVGYIHNETLIYLSKNEHFPKIKLKELYLLVTDFASNELRNINGYQAGISFKDIDELVKKYQKEPKKALEDLTFEGKLNSYSKGFIYKIIDESKKIEFPQYVSTELIGLKKIILLNSKLTNQEKTFLMGAATIGIYSNSFWSFQNNNPDSPWQKVSGDVVEKDIVGFITGCYACIAAGPYGCVGCGIIGAVVSSFLE